ncbi:hypothetical protein CHUAL_006513 [Chamberlinius hualienensis]
MIQKKFCVLFLWNVWLINAQITFSVETAQQLKYNCDNLTSNSFNESMDGINYCTFPAHKINVNCIAASCPDLMNKTLCPTYGNGTVNLENTKKMLEILTNCLKQNKICEFYINPITVPSIAFVADQMIYGNGFAGNCTIDQHTTVINNMSNTEITLPETIFPTSSPIDYHIEVSNLNYVGTVSCIIGAPFLATGFGMEFEVTSKNMPINVKINITAISQLALNGTDNRSNVEHSVATLLPNLSEMGWLKIFRIEESFQSMLKNVVQKSVISRSFGNFISAIVNSGFQVTKQCCSNASNY